MSAAYKDYAVPGDRGWIAVDFDGTLAHYNGWKGPTELGRPIDAMRVRVADWLYQGRDVRVFTARCWPFPLVPAGVDPATIRWIDDPSVTTERIAHSAQAVRAIQDWCLVNFGKQLPVTCVKDLRMIELYDDRAVQVEENTGRLLGHSTRGLA